MDYKLLRLVVANLLTERERFSIEASLNGAEKLRDVHGELREFGNRVQF